MPIEICNSNLFVMCYPLSNSALLPYVVNLKFFNGNLFSESERAFVSKLENNNFVVCFLPFELYNTCLNVKSVQVANIKAEVCNGVYLIKNDGAEYNCNLPKSCESAEIVKVGEFPLLIGNGKFGKFARCFDGKKFLCFNDAKIDIDNNTFKVLTFPNNLYPYGKVETFLCEKEIKLESSKLVKKSTANIKNILFLSSKNPCELFLKQILAKDYDGASKNLALPLKTKLTTAHLEKFFEDFSLIKKIDDSSFFLINNNNKKATKVVFDLCGHEISNVNIID